MIVLPAAAVEAVQKRGVKRTRRRVAYKRRYWDIENQQMVLEAQATTLEGPGHIASLSTSREEVDADQLTNFRVGNATVSLRDDDRQWNPRNSAGIFAADDTARLGYERRLMEFVIELVIEHLDGTETVTPQFTGRAVRWRARPRSRTVEVELATREVILERYNAEKTSTRFELKNLVSSGPNWVTAETGVGRFIEVRDDDGKLTPGIDFTQEDLDDPDLPGKIVPIKAIAGTPRATYIVWLKDQPIDQLVRQVMLDAGFDAGDLDIDQVTYPNRVILSRVKTSQADFQAAEIANTLIDIDFSPGDIRIARLKTFDDFDDGSFTDGSPRTWSEFRVSGGNMEFGDFPELSVSGGNVVINGDGLRHGIRTTFTDAEATWEVVMGVTGGSGTIVTFYFLSTNGLSIGAGGSGYAVQGISNPSGNTSWSLIRFTGGSTTNLANLETRPNGLTQFRITRDGTGRIKVWIFGTLRADLVDGTHSSTGDIIIEGAGPFGAQSTFQDVNTAPIPLDHPKTVASQGTITLFPFEGGDDFIRWSKANITRTLPQDTSVVVETATSPDNNPANLGAFQEVDAGNNVLTSPEQPFLAVRLTLNSNPAQTTDPTISEVQGLGFLSTTRVKLANFKNLTGKQVIDQLAAIANFNRAFTRSGAFRFKPRVDSGAVQHTVDQHRVREIRVIDDGSDRIYTEVLAEFGTHSELVSLESRGDARPHMGDKFQDRRLTIPSASGRQILLDPDANVARGLALSYLNFVSTEREVFEIEMDYDPTIETLDIVEVFVADNAPDQPWFIGDPSRGVGDADIRLYGEEQQSAYRVKGLVLAVRSEENAETTTLSLLRIN